MALDNPSPYTAQILAELQTQNLVNYHTAVPDALFRANLLNEASVSSIADLTTLTTLDLRDSSLTDVTGIEYATALVELKMMGNEFSSIDVAGMSSLTLLHVYDTQITELHPDLITGIANLRAYNTLITDLNVGNLAALTFLLINNCLIEQSELEGIVDALYANRVEIGALSCRIQLQDNPGSLAVSTSKLAELNALTAAGCAVFI